MSWLVKEASGALIGWCKEEGPAERLALAKARQWVGTLDWREPLCSKFEEAIAQSPSAARCVLAGPRELAILERTSGGAAWNTVRCLRWHASDAVMPLESEAPRSEALEALEAREAPRTEGAALEAPRTEAAALLRYLLLALSRLSERQRGAAACKPLLYGVQQLLPQLGDARLAQELQRLDKPALDALFERCTACSRPVVPGRSLCQSCQ